MTAGELKKNLELIDNDTPVQIIWCDFDPMVSEQRNYITYADCVVLSDGMVAVCADLFEWMKGK